MTDALNMGEYGIFIWAAYGAALLILAGLWLMTDIQSKRAANDVERLRPKRPKRSKSDESRKSDG